MMRSTFSKSNIFSTQNSKTDFFLLYVTRDLPRFARYGKAGSQSSKKQYFFLHHKNFGIDNICSDDA
jgi:hypothetical protein